MGDDAWQGQRCSSDAEQDAGLVSRRSSTSWEIHRQVLHYAASLLAQASFDEQQAAHQWLARLTAGLEQRHLYRQFRAQQPRLGLRAVVNFVTKQSSDPGGIAQACGQASSLSQ